MENEFKNIEELFLKEYESISSMADAESLKIKYLGRKSSLTRLFSKIPTVAKGERGFWGKKLNSLKEKIRLMLTEKLLVQESKESDLDLTFPGASVKLGSRHILSTVNEEICSIFQNLGFNIVAGNEIEDEWHNFQALNIPLEHPSRDVFDTFYLDIPRKDKGKHLLRSHTSPSQIRIMQKMQPPLAVISPGRVYRPDEVDATHSFMFHQIEGFAVGKEINFSHLKGVLLHFVREFFSRDVKLRFRPHFFPFTEPSAEVDISCIICENPKSTLKGTSKNNSQKCSVCKGKGWLEVLGCGMIHPNVLDTCGINSKKYKGFAFGMGVERIAMLKFGINDIRMFYENDLRFLRQF